LNFSDWYDLQRFQRRYLILYDQEFEENRLSQVQVRYSSRVSEFSTGDKDGEITFSRKLMKQIVGREKLNLYIIARLVAIHEESFLYRACLEFIEQYFREGYFANNERYFYLSSLTDSMFCYEIDSVLWSKSQRRDFFRSLGTPLGNSNKKINIFQFYRLLLESYDLRILPKKRPRKKVRHKGYRDHGTLGSDISRTNRDQAGSWQLVEKEEEQRKEKDDFLNFLLGLGGWI